jgi:hypothetical protein
MVEFAAVMLHHKAKVYLAIGGGSAIGARNACVRAHIARISTKTTQQPYLESRLKQAHTERR